MRSSYDSLHNSSDKNDNVLSALWPKETTSQNNKALASLYRNTKIQMKLRRLFNASGTRNDQKKQLTINHVQAQMITSARLQIQNNKPCQCM